MGPSRSACRSALAPKRGFALGWLSAVGSMLESMRWGLVRIRGFVFRLGWIGLVPDSRWTCARLCSLGRLRLDGSLRCVASIPFRRGSGESICRLGPLAAGSAVPPSGQGRQVRVLATSGCGAGGSALCSVWIATRFSPTAARSHGATRPLAFHVGRLGAPGRSALMPVREA